jgi:hypothetical protein
MISKKDHDYGLNMFMVKCCNSRQDHNLFWKTSIFNILIMCHFKWAHDILTFCKLFTLLLTSLRIRECMSLWDIFHKHWGVLVAKHKDACNLMGTIYSVVAGISPITT